MIKRKTTTFMGGELKIIDGLRRGHHNVSEQPVRIIRAIPETDEEEDQFLVEFHNLGRAIVDGCDLHPHPESRLTNVEFITDLMESAPTPMTQALIIEGAAKYAEAVAEADPEACSSPMLHGPAWHRTAVEVRDAIAAHFKG